MPNFPYIAPIDANSTLVLTPWPNGGWTVSTPNNDVRCKDRELGAFSCANEMLDALKNGLGDPMVSEVGHV
jgi:hypothetical protein